MNMLNFLIVLSLHFLFQWIETIQRINLLIFHPLGCFYQLEIILYLYQLSHLRFKRYHQIQPHIHLAIGNAFGRAQIFHSRIQ